MDQPNQPDPYSGISPDQDQEQMPAGKSAEEVWYEKYIKQPYKDLAAKMVELKKDIALIEIDRKRLEAEFDVIRLKVVPERFAEDQIKSTNIAGIGRLGIAKDAYCNQDNTKQEDFFKWLRDNEYGDLIKESVNPSSLKSLVKSLYDDHLASAGEFDPTKPDAEAEPTEFEKVTEFVKFTPFLRASVTKG